MLNVNFSQKKINLLKIMNGIILSLRWNKNPTFPFLLLPFLLLRGQIWAPKNTRKRNWAFQTPPSSQHSCGCPTKKLCPVFFFKLKEKKKHAKTRENSKFEKHHLWVSLVFQEIHRNTRNHKDMFLTTPTKRASKAFDTPMRLTQWPLLTHFLAKPLENRSIHDVRFFGVKNINQPYLSEKKSWRGWIPMNVSFQVSTGKLWFKSFQWKFWVDFLCFISCVFWWNFGFFCFWLFDQRSTNPADIPFLLTGAEGEVASSLLCRIFVPKNYTGTFLRSPFYD